MRTASFSILLVPALLLAACGTPGAPADPPTAPAASHDSPAGDSTAASAARAALADRLGVDAPDVAVEHAEEHEWSDSCLGLGGPAEICAAVITPGFAVLLTHDGEEYRYRTDLEGTAVRAE